VSAQRPSRRQTVSRQSIALFQDALFLSRLSRLLGALFVVMIVSALVIYSITVNYEYSMNELGNSTRDIHESNKDLHIKLNQLQAFKNVEMEAARLPALHPAEETLEVKAAAKPRKIVLPKVSKEYPDAYGY
jgi:cell division protein FtsL